MWLWWCIGCGELGLQITEVDAELTVEPRGVIGFDRTSPYSHGAAQKFSLNSDFGDVLIDEVLVHSDQGVFFLGDGYRWPRLVRNDEPFEVTLRFLPEKDRRYEGKVIVRVEGGAILTRAISGSGCIDRDHDGEC